MGVLNKITRRGFPENMAFEQKKLEKERMSLRISGKRSFQEEGPASAKAQGTASQGCLKVGVFLRWEVGRTGRGNTKETVGVQIMEGF